MKSLPDFIDLGELEGPAAAGTEVVHAWHPAGIHRCLFVPGVFSPVAFDLHDHVQRVTITVSIIQQHHEIRAMPSRLGATTTGDFLHPGLLAPVPQIVNQYFRVNFFLNEKWQRLNHQARRVLLVLAPSDQLGIKIAIASPVRNRNGIPVVVLHHSLMLGRGMFLRVASG